MRKIRSSTKIFIGFCAITAVSVLSYNKIQDFIIMGQHFAPISPRRVNIVGVTPDGYKVIVSNEVAQLVETQGGFSAGDQGGSDDSSTDGSVKKKISVKDMMGVLQGDSKSLSSFVMSMNDMSENDLPPIRVVWSKVDVEKALAGDPVMQAKLEKNLNMKLDGTPLSQLDINSIENGIVLSVPVSVHVVLDGQTKTVTGDISLAYKPKMIRAVEADVAQDAGKITDSVMTGYYKQEAEKAFKDSKSREDIRQYLKDAFSTASAQRYVDYPERILRTADVVVNDSYIDTASYSTRSSPNGKPLYDLHISLNDEGRRRLWKYSRMRVGDQILLTSDGVAIAVARIGHPLMGGEVTITNMKDQGLLDDLIANIKSLKSDKVAEK